MEVEKFLEIASGLLSEAKGLLKTKNKDYSEGEAFRNFEKQAAICGTLKLDFSKREHWALAQIVEKTNRLRELEGKPPHHDSVRDTCLDGINFFVLYYGMVTEKKEEEEIGGVNEKIHRY